MMSKRTSKMTTFLLAIGLLTAVMPAAAQECSKLPKEAGISRLFRFGKGFFTLRAVFSAYSAATNLNSYGYYNLRRGVEGIFWFLSYALLAYECSKEEAKEIDRQEKLKKSKA